MKKGVIREMKIVYIRLKGYVGIYSGMGLNELEIDLSKSKHKITVISGINGCGKSTLLRAISLMPDTPQDFIPNVSAEKHIKLLDGDNLYEITILSPVSRSSRGTTKCSIIKNGIELNPNGNVTSYKEIIFQEFELDSNFIALTRLSGDDRGLADKTPAERKKFMSFIVESLETYNAIYKNLNKKSSIFKSYVSNLHNKIQGVGNEENLRSTVISLENRRESLNKAIESLKNSIIESNTLLSVNDPDGILQLMYEKTEKEVDDRRRSYNQYLKEFTSLCNSIGTEISQEAVDDFLNSKTLLIGSHRESMKDSSIKKLSAIEKRETILSSIESDKRKVDELSKGVDLTLSNTVIVMREKVKTELDILKSIGISDPYNTSKEELEYTFDTIKFIVEMVMTQFYDGITEDMVVKILNFSKSDLTKLETQINKQKQLIIDLQNESKDAQRDYETLSVLSNRPKGCKIDDCYFISVAYNLQKKKYAKISIDKYMEELAIKLTEAVDLQFGLSSEYERMTIIASKKDILDRIRANIDMNKVILQKCDMGKLLIDTFESRILHLNSFNEFKDMDDMISKIITISMYKNDSKSLESLEASIIAQSNSEVMIRDIMKELERLETDLVSIDTDIKSLDIEISSCSNLIRILEHDIAKGTNAKEKGILLKSSEESLKYSEFELEDIIKKSKASITIMEKINSMNVELQELQSQLSPIDEQISRINGQLVMLESYKIEYQEYSDKYNMVDTLKKYSSPTGGIQTLFMSIYMNKTLELANQVLGMVFGGKYRILDYVINANEFRIPFVGDGLVVDDISSGSTSQVCMMGLAMSLVLLYQASTKYNITRLDEIDGGLDSMNKLRFIDALYRMIEILEIDQLFIISHSSELELSNVDIIRLKTYDNTETPEGNILYDFSSQTL